jgi:hypothetical protein
VNNIFTKQLKKHPNYCTRLENANTRLTSIREEFNKCSELYEKNEACVFCAGSLGRGDVGSNSDLDLFILRKDSGVNSSRLNDIEMIAKSIDINRRLKYDSFSNDGQYLKVYQINEMLKALGAPYDDSENLFTARMLLILESQPLCNNELYEYALDQILEHYFRDSRGKKSFRPLFLLNDLLRYWRTLCLNYELIRDDPARPWRKKNINLKFSRMLTVYGTILPLISKPMTKATQVKNLIKLSPHERFAYGLSLLNDMSLLEKYTCFLHDYEAFLSWKETMGSKSELSDNVLDKKSRSTAKRFARYMYNVLMHDEIESDLRQYLVL